MGSRACEPAFRRAYRFDERFIDKPACRPARRQDCPPHIAPEKSGVPSMECRNVLKLVGLVLRLVSLAMMFWAIMFWTR